MSLSGATNPMFGPQEPQKTTAAHTAKTAVNAANQMTFGFFSVIYAIEPRAMSANTIAKIATVSTMPSAAR